MRILLVGATGFIGRELFAFLARRGHDVVPAVRNVVAARALGATGTVHVVDLERDVDPRAWTARLQGMGAVVNCAGLLQSTRRQSIEAIHARAPIALFQAC